MKWHLLNWTLGPAILSGILATAGAGPLAGIAEDTWQNLPGTVVGIASFFGCWFLVMFVVRMIAQRLNEGRLAWSDVRLLAIVMAIQWALLAIAMGVLLSVRQGTIQITGGWGASWQALPVGALIGAAVGLPLGLGVARLRIPECLGLDKMAQKRSDNQAESVS